MARKKRSKLGYVLRLIWRMGIFIFKSPYYLFRLLVRIVGRVSKEVERAKAKHKREGIEPRYDNFRVVKTIEGDYSEWLKSVFKLNGRIGIILGSRGSGKTAFGIKLLENFYSKNKKRCFAMGFREDELPSWIDSVSDISKIKNNSFVLVDEGGILFNSRNSMRSANKLLSQLILVSRHKNINILFISQNSSNLEVNVLRQADFLVLKPSSLLQKNFERKTIREIYESVGEEFKKLKKRKGISYIHSDEFRGFVENSLPSFWKESLSKSFR